MTRVALLVLLLLVIAFAPLSFREAGIKVGSKKFTESVILGEMVKLLAEDAQVPTTHYQELGGTRLVFDSLLNGDIDIYPEYTGTIAQEILGEDVSVSMEKMRAALAVRGVVMSRPLGFNNGYVLGMIKARASELGITKVSDLTKHPDLVLGFSNEFMDRQDGWRNLRLHYDLPQRSVSGLDHDLAYRQLKLGEKDVIDAYATDAKISIYDLALLEDDRNYFPRYDAVLLYRTDFASRHPKVADSILRLEESISANEMTTANGRVDIDRVTSTRAASEYLQQKLAVEVKFREETFVQRIRDRTIEHLDLVRKSLIPAILIAIPLGIVAAKLPKIGQFLLAMVGIVQTIPALALLVMLMPAIAYFDLQSIGLGSATAVTALLLYSLLPIVRNTHAGLHGIAREHREAAAALGLPATFCLLQIELPLASRSILAGIKTAAVINVGFATLGALIGAGGYGQPIITGIRLNDTNLILEGAIPAALLALVVQGGFEFSERYLAPKGLRISHRT
ncbi:MAG: ABC transporter permease subunit [Pirellulales bacterium]|nr:ABC transporter permease subunit [Pirellulales bacterium]